MKGFGYACGVKDVPRLMSKDSSGFTCARAPEVEDAPESGRYVLGSSTGKDFVSNRSADDESNGKLGSCTRPVCSGERYNPFAECVEGAWSVLMC